MGVLFLIGPRGSGKTLAANLLGSAYACPTCDTDQLVVEAAGKSIAAIVAGEGWPGFRAREKAALVAAFERMAVHPHSVVATGGGIVLDPENRAFMRRSGRVAYLEAPVEVLLERLTKARCDAFRPALSSLSFSDEMRAVLAERGPLYRETAHQGVDATLEPEVLARALHEILTREEQP